MCNKPDKSDDCNHDGSGAKTYLICFVTLQDHVIQGFCDYIEGKSSLYVTTLPSLVAIGIVVLEI